MSSETSIPDFERAIKQEYGCLSAFNSRRVVHELIQERALWHGEVLTFDLLNHPTAARCYAWTVVGDVTTMLHGGSIDSPQAAIRAYVQEQHSRQG